MVLTFTKFDSIIYKSMEGVRIDEGLVLKTSRGLKKPFRVRFPSLPPEFKYE